jgi:hypothetical protein
MPSDESLGYSPPTLRVENITNHGKYGIFAALIPGHALTKG